MTTTSSSTSTSTSTAPPVIVRDANRCLFRSSRSALAEYPPLDATCVEAGRAALKSLTAVDDEADEALVSIA